jgi:hypothetical protein
VSAEGINAAKADRRAEWLESAVAKGLTEAGAACLWEEAFWFGKVVGISNAVGAITDHGLAVGSHLLMASLDAESAVARS